MRCFIFAKHAALWRPDGLCELYLADISVIDQLRTHDLREIGLPDEAMRSLWREASRIVTKADLFGLRELSESPFLILVDGRSGAVLERWEAQDPWTHVVSRLREVHRAA